MSFSRLPGIQRQDGHTKARSRHGGAERLQGQGHLRPLGQAGEGQLIGSLGALNTTFMAKYAGKSELLDNFFVVKLQQKKNMWTLILTSSFWTIWHGCLWSMEWPWLLTSSLIFWPVLGNFAWQLLKIMSFLEVLLVDTVDPISKFAFWTDMNLSPSDGIQSSDCVAKTCCRR